MEGFCSVLLVVTCRALYPQKCLSHGPARFGICTLNIPKDDFPKEVLHCSLTLNLLCYSISDIRSKHWNCVNLLFIYLFSYYLIITYLLVYLLFNYYFNLFIIYLLFICLLFIIYLFIYYLLIYYLLFIYLLFTYLFFNHYLFIYLLFIIYFLPYLLINYALIYLLFTYYLFIILEPRQISNYNDCSKGLDVTGFG